MIPPLRASRRVAARVGILTSVFVTAALLAGCTSSSDKAAPSSPPPSSATPTSTPPGEDTAGTACDVLDDATVESLIGSAPAAVEVQIPGSTLPACQYGELGTVGLQVAQLPADEWARSLPSIVEAFASLPDDVLPSVREQLQEAADAIEDGATVAPDEACEYFSRLLEVAGQEPGMDRTVNYVPDRASAMAVTGQQCESGVFSSVVVSREGIADDKTIVDEIIAVLDQLR